MSNLFDSNLGETRLVRFAAPGGGKPKGPSQNQPQGGYRPGMGTLEYAQDETKQPVVDSVRAKLEETLGVKSMNEAARVNVRAHLDEVFSGEKLRAQFEQLLGGGLEKQVYALLEKAMRNYPGGTLKIKNPEEVLKRVQEELKGPGFVKWVSTMQKQAGLVKVDHEGSPTAVQALKKQLDEANKKYGELVKKKSGNVSDAEKVRIDGELVALNVKIENLSDLIGESYVKAEKEVMAARGIFVVDGVFRNILQDMVASERDGDQCFENIQKMLQNMQKEEDERREEYRQRTGQPGHKEEAKKLVGAIHAQQTNPNSTIAARDFHEAFEGFQDDADLTELWCAMSDGTLGEIYQRGMYREYYRRARAGVSGSELKKQLGEIGKLYDGARKAGEETNEAEYSRQMGGLISRLDNWQEANNPSKFYDPDKKAEEDNEKDDFIETWRKKPDNLARLALMTPEEQEVACNEAWNDKKAADKKGVEGAEKKVEEMETKQITVKFFRNILKEKTGMSDEILSCIENDPRLLDMGGECVKEALKDFWNAGLFARSNPKLAEIFPPDVRTWSKEMLRGAYAGSGRAQAIFGQMRGHIFARVAEVDSYGKLETRQKSGVDKLEEKKKNAQYALKKLESENKDKEAIEKMRAEVAALDEQIKKKKDANKAKLNKLPFGGGTFGNATLDAEREEKMRSAYRALYKKAKPEDDKRDPFFDLKIHWFDISEVVHAIKEIYEGYLEQHKEHESLGSGKIIHWISSKMGKHTPGAHLMRRIGDSVFREHQGMFKKNFATMSGHDMELMFQNYDHRLANPGCLWVAVEKLVDDNDFPGWADPMIANVINKFYPKVLEGRRGWVSYDKDPWNYMDALFSNNGYGYAIERKAEVNERKYVQDNTTQVLQEGENVENHAELMRKYFGDKDLGYQKIREGKINNLQIFAWLEAMWEHKVKEADPLRILETLHIIMKAAKDAGMPCPIKRGGIHQLAGKEKDKWTALYPLVKASANPPRAEALLEALTKSVGAYLALGYKDAAGRASDNGANMVTLTKLHKREARQILLFCNKGRFESLAADTKSSLITHKGARVDAKFWTEFYSATAPGSGMIYEMGVNWDDPKITDVVQTAGQYPGMNFTQMIEEKRRIVKEILDIYNNPEDAEREKAYYAARQQPGQNNAQAVMDEDDTPIAT